MTEPLDLEAMKAHAKHCYPHAKLLSPEEFIALADRTLEAERDRDYHLARRAEDKQTAFEFGEALREAEDQRDEHLRSWQAAVAECDLARQEREDYKAEAERMVLEARAGVEEVQRAGGELVDELQRMTVRALAAEARLAEITALEPLEPLGPYDLERAEGL